MIQAVPIGIRGVFATVDGEMKVIAPFERRDRLTERYGQQIAA